MKKICSTCHREKDVRMFYRSGKQKDGYHNACRECNKASARKSSKTLHSFRRRNGLCVMCGERNDTSFSRCSSCLSDAKAYVGNLYKERIANGLCGHCGKRPLFSKERCEYCYSKYHEQKLFYPEKIMLRSCKRRAKELGLRFDLDETDMKIPKLCPLLNIPLEFGIGIKTDNSPTVDRIDPSKGYVKGNVWVISDKANRMKNNASLKEIVLLAENAKRLISQG